MGRLAWDEIGTRYFETGVKKRRIISDGEWCLSEWLRMERTDSR